MGPLTIYRKKTSLERLKKKRLILKMTEVIDNREKIIDVEHQDIVPVAVRTYYTITEQEKIQRDANMKQFVEMVNVLSTAMSAEGKLARPILLQLAQSYGMIKPQKREE